MKLCVVNKCWKYVYFSLFARKDFWVTHFFSDRHGNSKTKNIMSFHTLLSQVHFLKIWWNFMHIWIFGEFKRNETSFSVVLGPKKNQHVKFHFDWQTSSLEIKVSFCIIQGDTENEHLQRFNLNFGTWQKYSTVGLRPLPHMTKMPDKFQIHQTVWQLYGLKYKSS